MNTDKQLLVQLFGESSEEEEAEDQSESNICFWERFEEIRGLWICRDFLSPHHQSSLLSALQNEGWFSEASHNQAMRFGELPSWAMALSDSIHDAVLSCSIHVPTDLESCNGRRNELVSPFPSDLLWRQPLFDQLIANLYHPGEGICAHVDLMRFEDGIAIVSLESPCVMHFSQVEAEGGESSSSSSSSANRKKIPVYLNPGSLILMSGEARYEWKHEINRNPGVQMWEGHELQQATRTSITLRKLRCVE
ncbi:hypothetical protein F8388_007056 [Cannabis sativa]|uniref:Fe2OG dioxygenase domain-containing protein n=1 Tax=Cannabis sativa TaxID=3483 RepID=A0A7J6F3L6_CANSA|nr:hypothetical protein F8388_007056 [Cannabis sativa]KAF4366673.1 hypothetical protein G4B88_010748 [Cannabis sativa]